MSEQPEQAPEDLAPIMTDAEVEAAQLPPRTAPEIQAASHACKSVGYCYECGATNATP